MAERTFPVFGSNLTLTLNSAVTSLCFAYKPAASAVITAPAALVSIGFPLASSFNEPSAFVSKAAATRDRYWLVWSIAVALFVAVWFAEFAV